MSLNNHRCMGWFAAIVLGLLAPRGEADTHPLSPDEAYLKPYLNELVDYRDSAIGREYIALADIVDVVPTWMEDLFIPMLLPGSKVTMTLDTTLGPFDLKIQGMTLPATVTLVNVTIDDLNDFKKLAPFKLLDNGRFTWAGTMKMTETSVSMAAQLEILGMKIPISAKLSLKNLALDYDVIVAFDRARLCNVWGSVMRSSSNCALWPIWTDEGAGVSGLKLSDLRMSVSDFDVALQMSSPLVNTTELKKELAAIISKKKSDIIKNLPGSISEQVRTKGNVAALHMIPTMQRESPCVPAMEFARTALNVSRVCVSNNAWFDLKWAANNCPARLVSDQTSAYPIDQSKCMDMKSAFPHIVEGQTLRVTAQAVLGLHEVADHTLRYVPDSNAAGFECSGTTLDYSCKLVSYAPLNPNKLPQVESVCIINHAGFVMKYEVDNKRTGHNVAETSEYPIDQSKCESLASTSGVREYDEFRLKVHAFWGKTEDTDRDVQFVKNGLRATYECRGTTLDYHCKLMVSSAAEMLLV